MIEKRIIENKFSKVSAKLKQKSKIVSKDMLVVGCARLGRDDFLVKKGSLEELKGFDFGRAPHCLIIPGKLHFMEEEFLEMY